MTEDDFVLLLDEPPEIQPDLRRCQPWIAWISCLMNDLRGLDQIFGRQTATIYAGSTGRAFLSHDRGLAKLLGPQRSGEGGRPGAEDNQVIVGLCHCLSILKSFGWFFSTEQPGGGTAGRRRCSCSGKLLPSFANYMVSLNSGFQRGHKHSRSPARSSHRSRHPSQQPDSTRNDGASELPRRSNDGGRGAAESS